MMIKNYSITVLLVVVVFLISDSIQYIFKISEDKTKCPKVKVIRHFDLEQLLGKWYVVQFYASSEEAITYSCMQADLSINDKVTSQSFEVNMNFTYSFVDDPTRETLVGNITWIMPDPGSPAHWIHAEYIYEGVYNTYVLDSDYKSWALLLHCAEKSGSTRYLSSLIMSRQPELGPNVVSYLRDKLPRYDIDLQFMFKMDQSDCEPPKASTSSTNDTVFDNLSVLKPKRKHPFKRRHFEVNF